MKVPLKSLILIPLLTALSLSCMAQGWKTLDNPQAPADPAKIEVVEFFWYGCGHCFTFETNLREWKQQKPENVAFSRIPAVLSKNWLPHAKAYYVAEALEMLDVFHGALFDAIHLDKKDLFKDAQLKRFLEELGADSDKVATLYESDQIDKKIKAAYLLARQYKLTGVPAMVVQGRFMTSASMAGSHAKVIEIVNQLIAKVDQEQS